ncbi:hypothetical protein [uncultured Cohaesibacter sp.]|uniref:hypothetical protein n=1 Tax=uncultured Cohaesibacter sp. TaxID=1002546 RepID=UPI0029C7A592|nr:hypothetical protein [uncultured Cohaesibacter sp.]
MIKNLHPVAGTTALILILAFWSSTALSELFAEPATVIMIKTLIPYGFIILIPAIMVAGASGFRLGKGWRGPVITRKQRRMPFIAANGLLILIPSALYLSAKAEGGTFDTGFYLVQALELIAGAINITLLTLNMRDGLRLSENRRTRPQD